MFCAPPEIDDRIRKIAKLGENDRVDTLDVIRWAMLETCKSLEHHISHWAQQGVEYNRRREAQKNFTETADVEGLKRGWLVPESRSLESMYGVSSSAAGSSESFTRTAMEFPDLKERLVDLGVQRLEDPSVDEEQEREVSIEVERERQNERPPKLPPASHSIHPDVQRFVSTGLLPPSNSSGVVSLFHCLKSSGVVQPRTWSGELYASFDFCKVLDEMNGNELGDFLRPVNWILSGSGGELLVLSPYEANQLLPEIRKSEFVQLHVFAPRVIQSMQSFSDLRSYSVTSNTKSKLPSPTLLPRLQLGLFAGQLYFDDYDHYRITCGFLGIYIGTEADRESKNIDVQSDGFVVEADRHKLLADISEYHECGFANSPISTLKQLVGYRRKGMEYLRTHVGQMLHARQITPNDF